MQLNVTSEDLESFDVILAVKDPVDNYIKLSTFLYTPGTLKLTIPRK